MNIWTLERHGFPSQSANTQPLCGCDSNTNWEVLLFLYTYVDASDDCKSSFNCSSILTFYTHETSNENWTRWLQKENDTVDKLKAILQILLSCENNN